jgi:hypothetical protein
MGNMPICPYCGTEMYVAEYSGYYESFKYWGCACDDKDLPEPKSVYRGENG